MWLVNGQFERRKMARLIPTIGNGQNNLFLRVFAFLSCRVGDADAVVDQNNTQTVMMMGSVRQDGRMGCVIHYRVRENMN